MGHSLPEFRTAEQFCRIVRHGSFTVQIFEKDPKGRNMPGTGRRGKMPLFEPSDIVGKSIDVEPSGGTIAEPLEKVLHIPTVGGDTILRQLPFAGNVAQKTFEPSQPVCLGFDGGNPKFPPPGIELHGYVIGKITGKIEHRENRSSNLWTTVVQ